jgi:hypothetical protein
LAAKVLHVPPPRYNSPVKGALDMIVRSLALGATMLFAAAGPASAVCPGLDVLFQDSFTTLQPTWGEPTASVRIENGQLVMNPPLGTYTWATNTAGLYDDIDMCVTMTTVTGVDEADAKAGLVFWYEDVNNFYVFEIAPNGKGSVWRRQRGRWLVQVNWTDAPTANKGDGAINELRVTTVEDEATFYVIGTEFKKISGTAPEKGQQIGFFAGSPDQDAAKFAFDDIRATKP